VPAGLFEAAVLNPTARIVANVKAQHPNLPIIGFPRGAGGWLTRYAEATGVDGIGIDQMTDIAAVNLPAHVARQGNLDPILLLQGGDAMRAEAKRLVEAMKGRPFIFNLGHGVMQPTPPDHVAELVAAIRG